MTFLRLPTLGLVVFTVLLPAARAFDHAHAAFDRVLKQHVRDGLVNYAALKSTPGELDAYLGQLATVAGTEFAGWPEKERLAFLINLYNAATLKLIVGNYPLKSIRSIGWLPGAAWKQEGVSLFGRKISLDHVEHGIIRKEYRDAVLPARSATHARGGRAQGAVHRLRLVAQRSAGAMSWSRRLVLIAVVLALAVAFTAFDVLAGLRGALAWIEGLGVWGPVFFVLIYIVATVLFLPGSALTLGAGALFGVGWGSAFVSVGSVVGATAAFLIGRYFARDWVAKKIAGRAAFADIDRAVAAEGWKIVGLTRLSPAFPFSLLNYAFGLTQVKLRDYVLASWIGMMPGTVMYVYIGSLARVAGDRQRTPGEWALLGVGLAATIAVTVVITRIARTALARRTKTSAASKHD